MADETDFKRWAFGEAMDAAKNIHADNLYAAARDLRCALNWVEEARKAQAKREADEKAAKILAAYTDLADAA